MKFLKGSAVHMTVSRAENTWPVCDPTGENCYIEVWRGWEVVLSMHTPRGSGLIYIDPVNSWFMVPVAIFKALKAAISHAMGDK